MTLKNDVMFGYISKEDYKNAGLEVTYVDGISITGYNVEGGLDVVILSMINDKKVSVSYLYSSGNKAIITPLQGITSVVIPNTVMSIGKCAFTDNKLTEITIPSSVTNIGDYPNNVTSESVQYNNKTTKNRHNICLFFFIM